MNSNDARAGRQDETELGVVQSRPEKCGFWRAMRLLGDVIDNLRFVGWIVGSIAGLLSWLLGE